MRPRPRSSGRSSPSSWGSFVAHCADLWGTTILRFMPFNLEWLGHAGFRMKLAGKTVYIDPYRAGGGPAADVILITHDHFDHYSPEDVSAVSRDETTVIAPATVT